MSLFGVKDFVFLLLEGGFFYVRLFFIDDLMLELDKICMMELRKNGINLSFKEYVYIGFAQKHKFNEQGPR